MSLEIHPERSTVEELSIMHDDDPQSTKRGTKLVLALLAFIAFGAIVSRCEAAEVFRNTDDKGGPAVLKLYQEPCTNPAVLKHITPAFRPAFQRATLFYWGREWASCWYDHEGTVISVDDQGAQFQPLPRRVFREESI